jgi:hypothetical protein
MIVVLQIQMNYKVLWNRKSLAVIYSGILALEFAYKLRKFMNIKVEFRSQQMTLSTSDQ